MDKTVFLQKRKIMLQSFLLYQLLLVLSILPVVLLMLFIYRQDKFQKEPIKTLLKAFFGGMLAIVMDIVICTTLDYTIGLVPFVSNTVFYQSFITAGIPEELCKFLIFMMFIWRDKNFDEYFDGIVYATFISLGFACLENIEYVMVNGIGTAIVRALISVPGHFLFGVLLGYFLSLAKFEPEKRKKHIWTGLLLAMASHGLFDWLLMVTERLPAIANVFIILVFIGGDVVLWIFGINLIRKHQERSRLQGQEASNSNDYFSGSGNNNEYQRIDWNAGNRP